MADGGCAVGPNGLLLPSKILFFNDVDNKTPLPALATASTSSNTSKVPTSTSRPRSTLTGFLQPVETVGGSRRPQRTLRPSGRLLDPNNSAKVTAGKRRRVSPPSANDRPVNKLKVVQAVIESDAATVTDVDQTLEEITTEAGEDNDDENEEEDESAYASSKAMGEADQAVCISISMLHILILIILLGRC